MFLNVLERLLQIKICCRRQNLYTIESRPRICSFARSATGAFLVSRLSGSIYTTTVKPKCKWSKFFIRKGHYDTAAPWARYLPMTFVVASAPEGTRYQRVRICDAGAACDVGERVFCVLMHKANNVISPFRYCPLCFLKGFEKPDLIVRHLMLRCPRRSIEQFEFGSVISLIGKVLTDEFILSTVSFYSKS